MKIKAVVHEAEEGGGRKFLRYRDALPKVRPWRNCLPIFMKPSKGVYLLTSREPNRIPRIVFLKLRYERRSRVRI